MHFITGSGREEDYDDDCRKVSGMTLGFNNGEPTASCPQVDENKTSGKLGKIFRRETVLEVTVSIGGRAIQVPLTRRPWKTIRPANKPTILPVEMVKSPSCYVKRRNLRLACVQNDRDKCRVQTFAIETAAQIMLANPNSVEDTPATWPRMFNHPTTQPTIGRCFRGQS